MTWCTMQQPPRRARRRRYHPALLHRPRPWKTDDIRFRSACSCRHASQIWIRCWRLGIRVRPPCHCHAGPSTRRSLVPWWARLSPGPWLLTSRSRRANPAKIDNSGRGPQREALLRFAVRTTAYKIINKKYSTYCTSLLLLLVMRTHVMKHRTHAIFLKE